MPGVTCAPYEGSTLYNGLDRVVVDLGGGVEEIVQLDPEKGPKAVTLHGNTTFYTWSTPTMVDEEKPKHWKDMSSSERETMVQKVAKANRSRRELQQSWQERDRDVQAQLSKVLTENASLPAEEGDKPLALKRPDAVTGAYYPTDFENFLKLRFNQLHGPKPAFQFKIRG
mmetsp:Transcript_2985/g.9966  ORF Transcript_2985/g.9966 Transcript_2985/m.9966 type:complete len:170 (+) Transcript_2985:112-621(+)